MGIFSYPKFGFWKATEPFVEEDTNSKIIVVVVIFVQTGVNGCSFVLNLETEGLGITTGVRLSLLRNVVLIRLKENDVESSVAFR